MSVRPYRDILRRKSRQIMVGKVPVGGDAPISVQSMTNTRTTDIAGTIAQIRAMEVAGADIVRVSCPDEESTAALRRELDRAVRAIHLDWFLMQCTNPMNKKSLGRRNSRVNVPPPKRCARRTG